MNFHCFQHIVTSQFIYSAKTSTSNDQFCDYIDEKRRVMLFFVFLFITALFSPTTGDVIALGDTDFHQALESQEIWFVEFYAPWCNFCQKLAPVWHELSTAQADVKIAKIDCTKSKSLCGKDAYDITIYPTFKYIKVTCRREEPRTKTHITSHLDHPHLISPLILTTPI